MIFLDAPDEDFTVLDDNRALQSNANKGGLVQYTKTNSEFSQLSIPEKVDYSIFMTKYNVHDKDQLAQGIQMGSKGEGIIEQVFREGDVFAAVNRINTMTMLTAFGCIILMVVAIIVIYLVNLCGMMFGMIGVIDIRRYQQLKKLLVFTLGLSFIVIILRWFYERTMKRIEIIQYYIK